MSHVNGVSIWNLIFNPRSQNSDSPNVPVTATVCSNAHFRIIKIKVLNSQYKKRYHAKNRICIKFSGCPIFA